MKTSRIWIPVAMLLLCGGILGFALGIATTRPAAARADDAKVGRGDDKTSQPAAEAAARKLQRFGSMIGLRPEKKEEYIRLHADAWPEILAILKKCHFQNYSIYLGEIDGKLYLFSYFEYTGEDIAKDVARDEGRCQDPRVVDPHRSLPDPFARHQGRRLVERHSRGLSHGLRPDVRSPGFSRSSKAVTV